MIQVPPFIIKVRGNKTPFWSLQRNRKEFLACRSGLIKMTMEVKFGSGSVDYSLGLFLLRVMIVMRSPTLRMMDMFMGTKKLDVRNGANTRRGWRLRTCCYEVLMMELGDEEDDAESIQSFFYSFLFLSFSFSFFILCFGVSSLLGCKIQIMTLTNYVKQLINYDY